MKNKTKKRRFLFRTFFAFVLLLGFCFSFPSILGNEGGRYEITAQAAFGDSIEIKKYEVDMTLQKDRKYLVKERIQVEFLQSGLTMFYRSFAKTGAKYYDIKATCAGNADFYYEVAENPDYGEFIDVNCIGGAERGNIWTYVITYTMLENTGNRTNDIRLDVIGAGWPVDLNDVTVTMRFPEAISKDFEVHIGHTDKPQTGENKGMLSEDGKTWTIHRDKLSVRYNENFGESMAEPITIGFTLPDGALNSYESEYVFTPNLGWIALCGTVCLALAVISLLCFRKKREIISVVNIKAPDDMDPLKMGKWLDGVVDTEDITSMVYYFAHKGYLTIDLTDQDDPILVKKVENLPKGTPPYAVTLFKGLFKSGERVSASDLSEKFYGEVEKAKLQLPTPKMYDKKSLFGFFSGGIIGLLFGLLAPFFLSFAVGKEYRYFAGVMFAIPVILIWILAYVRENYRYKWKKGVFTGVGVAVMAIAFVGFILFFSFFGEHFLFKSEKFFIAFFVFACALTTLSALSRHQEYVDELGGILGFKDFIVYTEEDKIKVMLEENPELYYKVLPYAQVLGVTKEWEDKFKSITLPPPSWCEGSDVTLFDYMVFNHCMRLAMSTAMTPPQSTVGAGGGGGSFGGFGGGGFGGGGGGAR